MDRETGPTLAGEPSREDSERSLTRVEAESRTVIAPPRSSTPATIAATLSAAGRYEVREEMGRGGMGVVYRARDGLLGRDVAPKVLRAGASIDSDLLERFQREARAAAALEHPNIVRVHDVGRLPDGSPFYAMELLDGEDLARAIQCGRISPRAAVEAVRQVSLGLLYAHQKGILHRDLKPQNIFLRRTAGTTTAPDAPTVVTGGAAPAAEEVHALLLDFGLAKLTEKGLVSSALAGPEEEALTRSGQILGTPMYMAPEQADGRGVDARTDVYGLGASLYHALAHHPPFDAPALADLLDAVRRQEPRPPSRSNPQVDADLDTLCLKCLAKEPLDRYATAGDLAEDCRRYLAGKPLLARPVGPLVRLLRRARKNRVVTGLVAALLVAALGVGFVGWRAVETRREADRRRGEALAELSRSGNALVSAALAWRALGDLDGSREFAGELWEPIARLKEEDPRLAEPWYFEGRMRRALQDLDAAERCQDEAVKRASAPQAPESSRAMLPFARYERGLLRLNGYLRMRQGRVVEWTRARAATIDPRAPIPRVPVTSDLDRIYPELAQARRDIVDDLRAAAQASEAHGPRRIRTAAALGFERYLEEPGRAETARLLEDALAEDRYQDEVYCVLSHIASSDGDWKRAIDWAERGTQADRGFLRPLLGLLEALSWAEESHGAERDVGERLREEARMAVSRAPKEMQEDPQVVCRLADVSLNLGRSLARQGRDPSELYAEAKTLAQEVLASRPDEPSLQEVLACSDMDLGVWKRELGVDPSPELKRAASAFERVLSTHPNYPGTAESLSAVYAELCVWLDFCREDPGPVAAQAIAVGERALAMNPLLPWVRRDRGLVHTALADEKRAEGKDPAGDFEEGAAEFRRAIALVPSRGELRASLGQHLGVYADWERSVGRDPSAHLREARAECDAAVASGKGGDHASMSRGIVLVVIADWKLGRGEDPTDECRRSISNFSVTERSAVVSMLRIANAASPTESSGTGRGSTARIRCRNTRPQSSSTIAVSPTANTSRSPS